MALTVAREFTDPRSADLLPTVRQICDDLLAPRAARRRRPAEFPRDVFRTLGAAGLLSLPFPEEYGGGGLPLHDYLQMIEELASSWATRRSGRQRAHALVLPAGHVRERRAAAALAARPARRATCWAPTACPRPTPGPTQRRSPPGPRTD